MVGKLVVSFLCAFALVSCAGGSGSVEKETVSVSPDLSTIEPMVEVVVVDSTGQILGIKANQVGDYYLINPGNEQMVPIQGHSLKMVPEGELD